MATVGYTPAPYEQAYYEGLFQAADVKRAGIIGGQDAVAFFARSKLPMDVLKNIWTLADQPSSNSLDRRKFFTAVRLIQLSQNGQKAQGADLGPPAGVTLRPVVFEGVSGVSVPMPQAPPTQQQQQQQAPMRATTPTMQQSAPPMQPSPSRGAPPTPPRPPMQQQQPGAMSTALTAQDPYSMPPQEQARYEDLFPQYAKEDGYLYGAEAVALFSKSGLPPACLRDIWNLVDTPVDNRLDKLEFAMAMHLIVCVSKKNLPMPPSLPMSLKGLKSQQASVRSASPAMSAPPPQMGIPAPQMAGSAASVGSGMVAPPLQMGSSMSVGSGPPQIHDTPPAEVHAAPPLRPSGGMGISDAFEGLSGAGGGGDVSGPPPITASSLPDPGSFASAGSFDHQAPPVSTIPEPEPVAAPAPPPAPMEKPKSSKELASSYDMGDNSAELAKLKTMLQKLQAENISLKASLGSMTEDEKDVQKEIGATVAEIGKLSNELTGLRAQALAAKSALLEATAELNGHREKKTMITDLIGETKATKDAIDSAIDGVHEAEKMNEQPQVQAAPPSYEADLFGGFDAPAPAPVAESVPQQMSSQPMSAQGPPISTVSTSEEEENGAMGMTQAPPQTFNTAPASAGVVETVKSEEGDVMGAPPPPAEAPVTMFSNASPAIPHKTSNANPGLAASPSAAEVEDVKERAERAELAAREAEDTRRSLAQQADDLRQVADQAESEVREKEAHISEKKKLLRVGGKRKEMREVEKAKQDAAEKKKQFMDLQTQANNAQALALETRREADRLNQEAEQKEIEAAQAASLAQTQPVEQTQMPPVANGGGFAAPQHHKQPSGHDGFGGGQPSGHDGFGSGFAAPQHHKQPSDYGGFGGGFGIMGGTSGDGAWSIPSPGGSQNGDAAHPF